jgi:hypothetical protein
VPPTGSGRHSGIDWCVERTSFQPQVAELALAHTIGNAVEVAYRRGDLFEKRRQMMQAWATFCDKVEVRTKDWDAT